MAKDTKAAEKAAPEPAVAPVTTNAAKLEWPRDQWGMTSAFKQAFVRSVSSVRGNQEKQDVFLDTIRVMVQHLQARFEPDAAAVAARGAAIADADARRGPQIRVAAQPTAAAPVPPLETPTAL